LAHPGAEELRVPPPPGLLDPTRHHLEPGHLLVGPHVEWASLLGRCTAELHLALAADHDPMFIPEPLTAVDRRALYHGAGSLARRVIRQVESLADRSPLLDEVVSRQGEIIGHLGIIVARPIEAQRIRCHGDYHLGQVLWTGKDFVIIDFEGEPVRSLGQRRLKRPAVLDLAGMVRSFDYASRTAALRVRRDLPGSVGSVPPAVLESWLNQWYRWVARIFLGSYLDVAGDAGFMPSDLGQIDALLEFFLMEKAVYELSYEMNNRPEWIDVPAQGILDLLHGSP
jgi:maltose alpha-D-glucosyltransferase/alpha-amylase